MEPLGYIAADISEPEQLLSLIQQTVPVTVAPLNQSSIADYLMMSWNGVTHQFNRTQAGELLSNIDSFEDELYRYYDSANVLNAIIEGIITIAPIAVLTDKQFWAVKTGKLSYRELRYEPKSRIPPEAISIRSSFDYHSDSPLPTHPPTSCMYSYKLEAVTDKHGETKFLLCNGQLHKVSPSMYESWKYQLNRCGIGIISTVNYIDTAITLTAIYSNIQKPEHSTLERYYRPRIVLKERNPHIQALVNLSQAYRLDIGETKATALIQKYGCLANLLLAERSDVEQIAGIGKKTVEHLFNIIGREW